MRPIRTSLVTVAVTVTLAGSLAACSSSSDASDVATTTPIATPTASQSTGPLAGGDPSTWSPVRVTPDEDGATQSLVVGQVVIFEGFQEGASFESSNPEVFTASDAQGDGESTTVAGGQAIAPGTSEVIAKDGSTSLATFTFVVAAQ